MMCGASRELGVHRMRTKYLDVSRDNMAYVKQRRHTQKRTRKIIHRMLELLGKMLAELRRLDRENPCVGLFSESQLAEIETITRIYRQQRNHHESGNAKESIPNRIVSVNKPTSVSTSRTHWSASSRILKGMASASDAPAWIAAPAHV